jgi:hypothetical protein
MFYQIFRYLRSAAARLINLFDRYVPAKAGVIPPAAFYHL